MTDREIYATYLGTERDLDETFDAWYAGTDEGGEERDGWYSEAESRYDG